MQDALMIQASSKQSHPIRRHELDWLRVLAFGILIPFHIGMFYIADWDWHVKSQYTVDWLAYPMLWSNQWRMPLLFFIGGAACFFLLKKQGALSFCLSRYKRVLVPLIFGMVVIIPPQLYWELQQDTVIKNMSYWEFWLAYLSLYNPLFSDYPGVLGTSLNYTHLWFLFYIFFYGVLLSLISPVLDKLIHTAPITRLGGMVTPSIIIFATPLYFVATSQWLAEAPAWQGSFFFDATRNLHYFSLFLLGYAAMLAPKLWWLIKQCRKLSLMLAPCTLMLIWYIYKGGIIINSDVHTIINDYIWALNAWAWLLLVLGWSQVLLTQPNRTIQYLNGGVYCYYILHQTIIIVAGAWLTQFSLGPIIEPFLVTFITLVGCGLGYEAIKRMPFGRTVLGVGTLSQPKHHKREVRYGLK